MPRVRFAIWGLICGAGLLNTPASGQDAGYALERIVVSKGRVHLSPASTLRADELGSSASLFDAFRALPVDLQQRSPGGEVQADFSLRGSNFQGVLVLLDGQRLNDPQTAHHNSDIPLTREDVERIEVIPGVSSSVFGPDSIGGAIHFVRKKPGEKKRVLQTGVGTYQTGEALFSASDTLGDTGVRVSSYRKESAGSYPGRDFKTYTARLDSSFPIPSGEFWAGFGYQEKEFGAYDFYTPAQGYASKEWTKTSLLQTGLSLDTGAMTIKPNFLWRRHDDKFMLDKTMLRSTYLNHHRTDVSAPGLYIQKELGGGGSVGWGGEYRTERITSASLGKHRRLQKSIFADASSEIPSRLALGGALRCDTFTGFGDAYTGSLNARYRLSSGSGITLGVSRSIRVPSFTELYYADPTTVGSSALSEEGSLNYQVGYERTQARLSWGCQAFWRDEKDFIDWVKRSPAQARWQAENAGRAHVRGIEWQAKAQLFPRVELGAAYAYTDRRVYDQGLLYKYGQNYARHQLNTVFRFRLPCGEQTVVMTYKKRPQRRGWLLLDAALERRIHKHARLFCTISNLLNQEYQEIEGIPLSGRLLEAGVRLDW